MLRQQVDQNLIKIILEYGSKSVGLKQLQQEVHRYETSDDTKYITVKTRKAQLTQKGTRNSCACLKAH